MQMKPWIKVITVISLILALAAVPLLSACGGGEEPPNGTDGTNGTDEVVEFDVVEDAVVVYLADPAGNMTAADLFMMIAEDNAPYIVSIRSAADYAAGHIPGAVNKGFSELTTLSMDEDILIYCYTGQSGSMAIAILGVLDYDVQNLLHGMCSWSSDTTITAGACFDATTVVGYQVETTANVPTETYDFPELENTTSTDLDEIVEAAAATVSPKYITAADLNMKIAEEEDMTIISCRSAADYATGHIPGAINIGLSNLAENLDKIDPDLPVYVYCYTGHTAAQATALLNMLGYDAYSLKYGMCSWSSDETVTAGKCFDATGVVGYAVEQ